MKSNIFLEGALYVGGIFLVPLGIVQGSNRRPAHPTHTTSATYQAATVPVVLEGYTTTAVTVAAPTLYLPMRDDAVMAPGIAGVRIGVNEGAPPATNPTFGSFVPGALTHGALWLERPGTWYVSVWATAEDPAAAGEGRDLAYVRVVDPPPGLVQQTLEGRLAAYPSYHVEVETTAWDQVMDFRQRWGGVRRVRVTARGGDLRVRMKRMPGQGTNPDGIGYELLREGEVLEWEDPPLASLWVRADSGTATVSVVSWRTR